MPTGYTAAIANGIDFRTYAMDCARAFGACISLRDDTGGGDKIPELFEPGDYHAKALAAARASLADVVAMSAEDCLARAESTYQEHVASRQRAVDERDELRRKYKAMLAEVEAWKPPSPGHTEFHRFMRDQIVQSIEFDCSTTYLEVKPKLSGDEWRAEELNRLQRDIEHHAREHAKEIERTNSRNWWITELRASLSRE